MTEQEMKINNLVLHILDINMGTAVLSHKEIDLEGEGYEFVESLIRKMLHDDNTKNAHFVDESNLIKERCERLVNGQTDFLTLTREFAEWLYEIMSHQPGIPSADLICCQVKIDDVPYLGLLKLNYRTNFIHHVDYDGELNVNLLVKQKTVLPGENQKPEEAVLINLDDFTLKLVEREYELDGVKDYYLSKMFLGCSEQLSTAEKAKIINKVTTKLAKKYNEDAVYDSVARFRKSVTEGMEEKGAVAIERVAREIFRDDPGAQREYVEELRTAGITETEVQLSEKITERKYRNHRIKTDTGVEINFPSTYYENREMLEFVNNPDGTLTILIKKIGKIENK